MKKDNKTINTGATLRYAMLVPLALMIASIISSCLSYSQARQNIADELNSAMIALANENSELWTRPDTIAAIRQMHEVTHKPLIYQASDFNFRNTSLKDATYFTLALVDKHNTAPKIQGDKIASDSILLVPEHATDGLAVQIQGFADCSLASVFVASDQTIPGILFTLSIFSMTVTYIWKRRENEFCKTELVTLHTTPSLDGIRLTPMQRQFVQMLLDAQDMRVDKRTLCETLWGNKSNAEESLYTLVRRTKTALAAANMEIICNRGNSYELRINS
ncbi:MAG: hypothetical protein ACI4ES_01000 [Roseburia sp.]